MNYVFQDEKQNKRMDEQIFPLCSLMLHCNNGDKMS